MGTQVFILAGGAGTRLKPLSQVGSGRLPKQFLVLTGTYSLLQETLLRIPEEYAVTVIPELPYSGEVMKQARAAGKDQVDQLVEPFGCNTAPAVFAAAARTFYRDQDPERVICLLPADHRMDAVVYQSLLRKAVRAAEKYDRIVTIGISPSRPETGYGYIQVQPGDTLPRQVRAFVEKPDGETARRYLESGDYYWNAGMFIAKARVFIELGMVHCPDLVSLVTEAFADPFGSLEQSYRRIQEQKLGTSIDYALMEHIPDHIALIPAGDDLRWNDLGSWEALEPYLDSDVRGNTWLPGSSPVIVRSTRTMVCNYTDLPVSIDGMEDMVVVISPYGMLARKRNA